MNLKHICIVLKKEMKDSFRDKKTVITNIILPLIIIPIMYFCINTMMKGANKEIEDNFKISIITNENMQIAEEFTRTNIIGANNIEILQNSEDTAKEQLMEGIINCIIIYSDGFFESLKQGNVSNITLEYNSLKNSSELGMQILQTNLMALNQKLASDKLVEIGISPDILNLVEIEARDASLDFNDGKTANKVLMIIIPMYLAITIVTAGIPVAIDVISGERERNTFEPLLATKANRLSILIGKYMSVLVFSIVAVTMSFIGLILGIILNPEIFSDASQTMSISQLFASMNMPMGALVLTLLSAITLAIVFAGVQIAISTWSKSVKEAQTYLSYMIFPVMIMGFATMFMGAGDIKLYMTLVPVFNTIASLKMVLGGVINYLFLGLSVIVNIVFVALITALIVKMFSNEKTIVR